MHYWEICSSSICSPYIKILCRKEQHKQSCCSSLVTASAVPPEHGSVLWDHRLECMDAVVAALELLPWDVCPIISCVRYTHCSLPCMAFGMDWNEGSLSQYRKTVTLNRVWTSWNLELSSCGSFLCFGRRWLRKFQMLGSSSVLGH